MSNTNVVYENQKSFEELVENKNWLTSNEAEKYIRHNCPEYWSNVIGNTYSRQKYVTLYREVKDGNLDSVLSFTPGGTAVRFYSKEHMDYKEKKWTMGEKEYEIYTIKREMEFAKKRISKDRDLMKKLKEELTHARS